MALLRGCLDPHDFVPVIMVLCVCAKETVEGELELRVRSPAQERMFRLRGSKEVRVYARVHAYASSSSSSSFLLPLPLSLLLPPSLPLSPCWLTDWSCPLTLAFFRRTSTSGLRPCQSASRPSSARHTAPYVRCCSPSLACLSTTQIHSQQAAPRSRFVPLVLVFACARVLFSVRSPWNCFCWRGKYQSCCVGTMQGVVV